MPAVKRGVPLKISTPIVPANNPKMMETKFFSLSSDPMVETATKPIKANKKYSGSPWWFKRQKVALEYGSFATFC